MENEKLRIIAVDFDGTLVEDKFPSIGEPIYQTWIKLFKEQSEGSKIILWTCRNGEALEKAVEFCTNTMGFHFDAINENLDEIKVLYGGDTRKVFATEYWDDKAVLFCKERTVENQPKDILDIVRSYNKQFYERQKGYV